MIYALDRSIGQVMDAINRNGIEGDTIVIFSSDVLLLAKFSMPILFFRNSGISDRMVVFLAWVAAMSRTRVASTQCGKEDRKCQH